MRRYPFILTLLLIAAVLAGNASAMGQGEAASIAAPLRVLIDVRTTHSDGDHDMQMLADLAKKRGIQALGFVDHGRKSIRFGLDPVPGILGYTKDFPSLYTTGLPAFFTDLAQVRSAHPEMTLFAGTESIAGYTWTGIPLRDLTVHNSERMFITLGAESPGQIEALPSFSLKNIRGVQSVSITFWIVIALIVILLLLSRGKLVMALLLLGSFAGLFFMLLNRPAINTETDLLDSAHQQGLFVIWAYPGTLSGVRPGPAGVQLDTPPYSERVFVEPTADAFAAIYGDTDSNTVPGGLWDLYLQGYMQGMHRHPIWAVAAGDFHGQGRSGEYLGNYPMDVWATENTPLAIMTAMKLGHMVAWRTPRGRDIRVSKLYLQDMSGKHLLPGDGADVTSQVIVHIGIDAMRPEQQTDAALSTPLLTDLIVDGIIAYKLKLRPGTAQQRTLQLDSGPHVIRLRIADQGGVRMEANPFLLRVAG